MGYSSARLPAQQEVEAQAEPGCPTRRPTAGPCGRLRRAFGAYPSKQVSSAHVRYGGRYGSHA